MKPVAWLGDSLERLKEFPQGAKHDCGIQLSLVQQGREPTNWKAMPGLGPGVIEIRYRSKTGAFRVAYVANRDDAIYVLHAFQKKSQATARKDVDLIKRRYKEIP